MADDEEPEDGKPDDHDDESEQTFADYYRQQIEATQHQLPDGLLQFLVDVICNRHDASFGVTLFVHGTIVSGLLVGVSKYLAEVADEVDKVTGDAAIMLAQPFRESSIGAQMALAVADDDDTRVLYVHLVDATVFLGGHELVSGVRWRGRLASVDGWSLGYWTTSS